MTEIEQVSTIRIAMCAYFTNMGGTTRAIEIAKSICDRVQRREFKHNIELRFFGNKAPVGMSYERLARAAGFTVEYFEPAIDAELWLATLQAERTGDGFPLFPPPYESRAVLHLRGVMEGLQKYQPTLVVHGLFPEVSIATKILGIPTVSFGPIPLSIEWMKKYFFDTSSGPVATEENEAEKIFRRSPYATLYEAALECGWDPELLGGPFTMIPPSDMYLICDLESNYPDHSDFGEQMNIMGPIFARSEHSDKFPLQDSIQKVLGIQHKKKVFMAMGSTGESSVVLEAAKALCNSSYNAVIALPATGCTLDKVKQHVGVDYDHSIVITEEFLPSDQILPLVDVMVTHGGQGSIQCALAYGIPIVGYPMQKEQQFNLQNVERRGAGILIPQGKWTVENIRAAIDKVIETPAYSACARQAQKEISDIDGSGNAADAILAFAITRFESDEKLD